MADERRPQLADLWNAAPPLRRDARRAAAGLPAAAPVSHARPEPPAVSRGRLIAGFTAVVVIGVTATAGLLASGPVVAESGALLGSPFRTVAANGSTIASDDAVPAGEGGGALSGPRDGGRAGEARTGDDGRADDGRPADAEGARSGGADGAGGSGPTAPDEGAPGQGAPGQEEQPQGPGPSTPAPGVPSPAPAPSQPAPPSPAPSQPAPQPSQPAPQPSPQPPAPAPPAAPQPLRFTGLVEHYTSVLFIRLLSSYTLSLSGEPGATASISYGSRPAGSVTFNGSGRASLTLGKSLIDLGLTNPLIRAAYSDGTEGAPIEARRDSI